MNTLLYFILSVCVCLGLILCKMHQCKGNIKPSNDKSGPVFYCRDPQLFAPTWVYRIS